MPSKFIRSPAYPSMSLRDAVSAVEKIERNYRTSAVDRTEAAKMIGYSALSGPANKALAALASYGLVDRAGKGEMRVTPRAISILHAANDAERAENLLLAATEPQLFQNLRERFPDLVPPESGVITYLNREGFNPTAVKPAAKAFLETMLFIEETRATESHSASPKQGVGSPTPPEPARFGGAKIGDLIQWENQGALQFETPKRVRWISDDGAYLAVEGSDTGLAMSEAIVLEKGAVVPSKAPAVPPEPAPATDLNKIKTSFDDDTVRISAWLDADGVADLEKKLAGIKMMLGIA